LNSGERQRGAPVTLHARPQEAQEMSWPENADGDAFRRLEANGFDFSSTCAIDFNVDFEAWPPSKDALAWLEEEYGPIAVHEPEENFGGYVSFTIRAKVTYELVMSTQEATSAAMAAYDGVCESWGVLH